MTSEQLQILRHALGIGDDGTGTGTAYRNHFVTGDGSTNHPNCMALVASGHMERGDISPLTGGDDLFIVTAAGAIVAKGVAPKKTQAASRYDRYLSADCGLSFGEWLKSGQAKGGAA